MPQSPAKKGMILKIETKELENCQMELTVEVDSNRLQSAMQSAAKRLSKETKISGFRPGKAPYEVIRNRFGDEVILDEALDTLGQDVYREALEDSEIDPYAPGRLEEVVTRDPLVLRFSVPTSPQVDLGNYRDLRIDYEEPEVTDQAVEDVMEELRQNQALIEPVERGVQLGDLVVIDVRGELQNTDENEDPILIDEQGSSVVLDEETDWPIQGISNYLMDKEADEKVEIDYEFPEDYRNEGLQGKSALFEIKIQEVKSRFIPDWSDDLAQNLGDFESLLDLRVKVRESLQEQATQENESEYSRKVVDEIVAGSSIEFPPVVLEQETADMIRELEVRLKAQNLTLENYLKITQQSQEELLEELKPQAEERIRRALVLGKVLDIEGIEVAEEEIDTALDNMLQSVEEQNEALRKVFDSPSGRSRIAMDLLTEKSVGRLTDIAKGEAPPLEADENISVEESSTPVSEEVQEIDADQTDSQTEEDNDQHIIEEQVKDNE